MGSADSFYIPPIVSMPREPEETSPLKEAESEVAGLEEEYETIKSNVGPVILGIIGVITASFIVGILLIIVAFLWYLSRVNGTPHVYQRLKEARAQRDAIKEKLQNTP